MVPWTGNIYGEGFTSCYLSSSPLNEAGSTTGSWGKRAPNTPQPQLPGCGCEKLGRVWSSMGVMVGRGAGTKEDLGQSMGTLTSSGGSKKLQYLLREGTEKPEALVTLPGSWQVSISPTLSPLTHNGRVLTSDRHGPHQPRFLIRDETSWLGKMDYTVAT